MKYVPSLPPQPTGGVDIYRFTPLSRVDGARPVQQRSVPPLVFQRRQHGPVREVAERRERRHDPHPHGERRTYCRRTEHLPVLLELRSGHDRRQHRQRASDATEHVDEEA